MRILVVALVALSFTGCSKPVLQADASTPADAPSDAGGFVPTESHALGLNDISMLIQLPEDPFYGTSFVRMTGFPGGGELVPRDGFAQLVTTPGDVEHAYEEFHLVALRFDLCDRSTPMPCVVGADGQLRIVFQPVAGGPVADDVALHAFYPIPSADLAPVVNELRALARIRDFQTASPLAVHELLVSTAPPSEYAKRLRALVAAYASADRLVRLSLFAQDAQATSFNWVFRAVERTGNGFSELMISSVASTQQRTILVDPPWPPTYATSPVVDDPVGLQLALDSNQFAAATPQQKQAALAALAAAQNPTTTTFHNEQCVNCHVATILTVRRAAQAGVDPATIPGTFTSARNVSIQFGMSGSSDVSLRAFGWFHQYPAISNRVANDTAQVLDEIDQRFPPAPTTILPDAGVPDSPPSVKRVFVTRTQYSGDLKTVGSGTSGLDGADRLCAAAATQLGGQWVAWLSTSTVDAIDRITGAGPWYRVDGTTMIFASKAAIVSGPLAAIDRDETNAQPPGGHGVWTGTGVNGRATTDLCNDWASPGINAFGTYGLRVKTDASWTADSSAGCVAGVAHLYCFEL